MLRCSPRCFGFGPGCNLCAILLAGYCTGLQQSATETGAKVRASISVGNRRKWRRGLELGPEGKTPQAVRACGAWVYGKWP